MKNKLKKEFHYFVLTDYELEEEYLRKMHKNGYKFVKVLLPGIYYFEACEPEDVIYKLDFHPHTCNEQKDYIQMYQDYGWEYLQDMNEYSYFRKKALEAENEAEREIFSDEESKLEMLKRIFVKRMIPIFLIFFLCVIPQIIRASQMKLNGPWDIGFTCFWMVMVVIYLGILGRCCLGFYRLRKKYSRE